MGGSVLRFSKGLKFYGGGIQDGSVCVRAFGVGMVQSLEFEGLEIGESVVAGAQVGFSVWGSEPRV